MAGIYIHIAASLAAHGIDLKQPARYARALVDELEFHAHAHAPNETIESIYIGGRTHGLSEAQHRKVLESLLSSFDTVNLDEITLEVTPGELTRDALAGFVALGVSRIQVLSGSFFDEDLQRLSLPYTAQQVLDTIEEARACGIEKIGVDLCLDTPGQPFEYWGANLEKAVHWRIEHVAFHRRGSAAKPWPQPLHRYYGCAPLTPGEKERHDLAIDYFRNAGYDHYLWLEFARPGKQCAQSLLYVQHANMLGIGAGAHSFWWHGSSHTRAARWANVEDLARYVGLLSHRELPVDARSSFHLDDLADEYIMLQLQSAGGLDLVSLEVQYGIDLLSYKIDELASLESKRWIEPIRNSRVRLTQSGKLNYPLVYHRLISNQTA